VRDVRGLLILEHLADQEDISVTDDVVDSEIQTMAEEMQQPAAGVRDALSKNNGLERMRGQIKNNKILELLRDKVKLVPRGTLTRSDQDQTDEGPSLEL
jgi:trigger factor